MNDDLRKLREALKSLHELLADAELEQSVHDRLFAIYQKMDVAVLNLGNSP